MARQHHQTNGHEFEQTGRQWRTEESGVLQSMGSQRVRHDLAPEQQRWDDMYETEQYLEYSMCLCAKSCPTLCDPMDCTLLCPWNFPGKNTGEGC